MRCYSLRLEKSLRLYDNDILISRGAFLLRSPCGETR